MSAIQKEQVYVQLRQYHLDEFSDTLSSSAMDELLSEYRLIEDEAVGMLLGLVNGKSEYVEMGLKFKDFTAKVLPVGKGGKDEESDRIHLASKALALEKILMFADKASFTIKPSRKARQSTRAVVTKITKNNPVI